MNGDCVEIKEEFFAWDRVCRSPAKRKTRSHSARDRGLLFLQTTDELGAQVALLQSPIPPGRNPTFSQPQRTTLI
jgi:hypothetical protein